MGLYRKMTPAELAGITRNTSNATVQTQRAARRPKSVKADATVAAPVPERALAIHPAMALVLGGVQLGVPAEVAPKQDRYKLGQAAYMREYRKRAKK